MVQMCSTLSARLSLEKLTRLGCRISIAPTIWLDMCSSA
jgi:hypothetical protein